MEQSTNKGIECRRNVLLWLSLLSVLSYNFLQHTHKVSADFFDRSQVLFANWQIRAFRATSSLVCGFAEARRKGPDRLLISELVEALYI